MKRKVALLIVLIGITILLGLLIMPKVYAQEDTLTGSIELSENTVTNQDVIATLTTNREIETPDGWTKMSALVYTKKYTENTPLPGGEQITIVAIDDPHLTAIVSLFITNIDKEAPIFKKIEYSPSQPTTGNVKVIVTFEGNGKSVYSSESMQIQDGWMQENDIFGLIQSKEYNDNDTEDLIFTDVAGNQAVDEEGKPVVVHVEVKNIDREDPIITIKKSIDTPTNQDVVVTISSNEPLQDIPGWNANEDKTEYNKTFKNNDSEILEIKDLAGNTRQMEVAVDNIDRDAPKATISYDIQNPTNTNVTAIITAEEELQGINNWVLSSDHYQLTRIYSENANEPVTIYDLAGNEKTLQVQINNIDKTEITASIDYDNKKLTNQDVTVTIKTNKTLVIDHLQDWQLINDNKAMKKVYTSNVDEVVNIIDDHGNKKAVNIEINNIDKTGPKINVSRGQNIDNTAYFTISAFDISEDGLSVGLDDKSIKYEFSNTPSQPGQIMHSIDNGSTIGKEVRNNETYYLWVSCLDLFGNKSVKSYTIEQNNYNEYPIRVEYNVTNETRGKVTATITAQQTLKALDDWKISSDKYSLTREFSTNTNTNYTVKFENGEEAIVNINIQNIIANSATGDVNNSGSIDIGDVLKVQRHITAKNTASVAKAHPNWVLSNKEILIGDLNGNGVIDVVDLLRLRRHISAKNSSDVAKKHPDWIIK